MKKFWIFICLFILSVSAKLSISNTSDIPTINGRVDGWINYDGLYNYELINMINSDYTKGIAENKIGLYIFNPIEMSYERRLEIIEYHGAKAAILRAFTDNPGDLFYNTDASGTNRFSIPVVEMSPMNFDMLVGMIMTSPDTTIHGNLTFIEKNPYVEFDNTFGWHLIADIHILWQIVNFAWCIVKLYQFNFFSRDMSKNIKNERYILAYLCLGITCISTILKFVNAININNVNLLYEFKSSRILYTIHLLFFIISHMLLGLWAFRILILAKSLGLKSRFFGKKTVITFISLCILLVILEFISDIGTYTFAHKNPFWVVYVLGIYVLFDLGMIGLYSYSNISILLMIRKSHSHSTNKKAKLLIRRIFFSLLGMFIWFVMLLVQFGSFSLAVKRYTGIIGFLGINISETALILSYDERLKNGFKSTTKSTKKVSGSHSKTSTTLQKTQDVTSSGKKISLGGSYSLEKSPNSHESSIHIKLPKMRHPPSGQSNTSSVESGSSSGQSNTTPEESDTSSGYNDTSSH